MSSRIALAFLLLAPTLSCAEGAFDGLPLYVYVFVCPARVVISSEVRLDRDIDVDADGLPHALTGRVTQRDGKLYAHVRAYVGSGTGSFAGEVELDRPVYATSSTSGSGLVVSPSFVFSHRLDIREVIEKRCSKTSNEAMQRTAQACD